MSLHATLTGYPFWRFAENRYCALIGLMSDFNQMFTKCSPVDAKYGKVVKFTNNKIM
jgi:hypothetical protein